jgi:predicted permease
VAGMLIAQLGGSVLRATFLPKATAAPVAGDPRTLLFAGAAALAAGLLTGLAPALQATKTDLTTALKAGAREGTYHRSRLRIALLVMQGALSVVLLVGAGLFVKSLGNVKSVRLGYDVTPVLLVNLNMRGVELDSMKKLSLYRDLMDKARALPGVEAVSKQVSVPFWSSWTTNLHVAGIDSVNRLGDFYLNGVSPDYFKALGTRIIRGRGITDEDREGAPGAMVVSEAMAKVLWPGKDPLGQCVRVEADTVPCTYVVGIAESIKNQKLGDDPGLQYYLSAAQQSPIQGGLFIRVHGDAAELGPTVRRGLQPAMPGASYITVTPMSEVLGGQTKSWELGATMFLAFGVLAFVLAAIGLYSVISYDVARRTHELGVRVALGAQVGDLIRLVVSGGLGLAAVGVVIGSVAAFAAGRWVAPLLFNESPRDPVVFALVAGLLMAVAFVASFLPARRAANVDPNRALRSD